MKILKVICSRYLTEEADNKSYVNTPI